MSLKFYKSKRRAGEFLKEKLFNRGLVVYNWIILIIILLTLTVNELFHLLLRQSNWLWLFISVSTMLIMVTILVYLREKKKAKNEKKGLVGEEYVGDFLQEDLKSENLYIINDFFVEDGKYKYNIDHILISKKGVFIIETKNHKDPILSEEIIEQVKCQMIYLERKLSKKAYAVVIFVKEYIDSGLEIVNIKRLNINYLKSYLNKFPDILSTGEVKEIYDKLNL